jgi:molybdate transport system permease protein
MLGASGSGKSMTLRCIAGLATPDRGRIVLNDRVLFDADQGIDLPSRQRRVGFVFQNYALFPHMRVARNIGFGLQHLPKQVRKQRVNYYLELFQLQGLEKRYPQELSGGQQQRVALARALAPAPEALLLDEPLSALDSYLRRQIEQLLAEVFASYNGVPLLVTHKLEEAYRICQQLLVLSGGRAISSGRKQDIFERPPTFTVAQLTECKNISAAQPLDDNSLEALDWGSRRLRVLEPIIPSPHLYTSKTTLYVGIRAHHLKFIAPLISSAPDPSSNNHSQSDSQPQVHNDNCFPCWLTTPREGPHRVTLYLRLQAEKGDDRDYQLQAEVSQDQWLHLKTQPQPWQVYLDPVRLIVMYE